MYIPKELKLNRFKLVRIPSGKELFGRYGQGNPNIGTYDPEDALPIFQSKLDAIASSFEAFKQEMENNNKDTIESEM